MLFTLRLIGFFPTCCSQSTWLSVRVRIRCGMRNAENSQRAKCRKFCAERSAFYPLAIFLIPHSALSGGWSLHGTLAIDMYVHVHKTLFKFIFACMYNVWM